MPRCVILFYTECFEFSWNFYFRASVRIESSLMHEEHKHSVIGKHIRDAHGLTPKNLIKNFKVIKN